MRGDLGGPERRKHPRLDFVYPVSFRFVAPEVSTRVFRGMMQDISLGGACILFDHRYLQFAVEKLPGQRTKLEILPLEGKPIHLMAVIRWARREGPKEEWTLMIGVAFEDTFYWDQEKIETFVTLTTGDQRMLWSLWDGHERSIE